eukprot:CAMPEP_0119083928 /NCGR_PEP_ID=MMETSP1178-20130426/127454_1 /TAXON_ID=33656 /ORGANISM="unid sp, Strain CCMP2000" /LENGTH=87 /DNA_ID=CAMNT_0007066845 /DNA_START=84 /DNA_END=344 /DNA_ORIENTATION=+
MALCKGTATVPNVRTAAVPKQRPAAMVSKEYAPSILVADGLAPSALTLLRTAGAIVVERHYPQAELGAALGEYDAVIIRSATTLTSE